MQNQLCIKGFQRSFKVLLLVLFLVITTVPHSVKAAAAIITPAPSPTVTVSTDTVSRAVPDPNTVQVKDIYEILLRTKDDKISFLSNVIGWLIGIAALVIVGIGWFFGYLQRNIRLQSIAAGELITGLQAKEVEISDIQVKINTLLESTNFLEKMITIDLDMKRVNDLTTRWEKEEIERNIKEDQRIRIHALTLSRDLLYEIQLNNMKARMTDDYDIGQLEMCKEFVETNVEHMEDSTATIDFKLVYMYLNTLKEKYQLSTDHKV